ncbi:MAG: methyltransferase domain-containing protein [Candidatus Kariarchaeaceae archaeon]
MSLDVLEYQYLPSISVLCDFTEQGGTVYDDLGENGVMNDDQQAIMYDQMINWEARLKRELPKIVEFFDSANGFRGSVLDVACSSGRHSLGLAEIGYQPVGIDISEPFISLANNLAKEHPQGQNCQFFVLDGTQAELVQQFEGTYFDHAILLGNAIANMGSFEAARQLMRHIFILLKPEGSFFVQTIHRPSQLWYNPLRRRKNAVIQRIMVPVQGQTHNVVLHVNQMVVQEGEVALEPGPDDGDDWKEPEIPYYLRKSSDNTFFMFTHDEFVSLVTEIGFDVESVLHHYGSDPVQQIDGETQTWRLRKPAIELTEAGISLFSQYANLDIDEIKARTLKVWQKLMLREWYHCMRSYRFLHPRIVAHPRYSDVVNLVVSEPEIPVLDVACFMGTDLRQLSLSGAKNLHGLDIYRDFIEAGNTLFGDKDSSTINFHVFDVLTDDFIKIEGRKAVGGKFSEFASTFGVIHAGSLIHLLSHADGVALVQRMLVLLREGGVFFGRTVGSSVPIEQSEGLRYRHSLDSLTSLFKDSGFSDVEVVEMPRNGPVGESSSDTVLQLAFYCKR